MARKKISVQADHSYINRVKEIARNLKKAGMIVEDEIAGIGHFRGIAEENNIESIKALPGVAAVNIIGDEGETEKDDYSISE